MTIEFVNVKPVIVADVPDAHQVWLDVGCQHFTVGDYLETKEEAEWLADQLVTAIDAMLPVIAEQEFDSVIADMQARAKTFLNTENTEIFGWIKRLAALQAATAGKVTDAMVERGLKAAISASDARLPRYSVVREIIEAAISGGDK